MEKEKGAVGSGVDFVRKAWRERKDTGQNKKGEGVGEERRRNPGL